MVSLGEDISQQVLKHHFLEVDGSQVSVSNALVGLIKMYESTDSMHEDNVFEADTDEMSSDSSKYNDDENNYDFLPAPRPKISILRVIPTVLYEVCRVCLSFVLCILHCPERKFCFRKW